ncbi:hypothetical protein EYF80_025701 [Liparis tanakae]|uniref:Uncharacterized protein n=1 Tax=Liparis tanakae TaxID=230148 RepID=A0A4Z2HGJ2_9TELE|nr:hypothetical protein EYF80_025701 [Liparis tanakae]
MWPCDVCLFLWYLWSKDVLLVGIQDDVRDPVQSDVPTSGNCSGDGGGGGWEEDSGTAVGMSQKADLSDPESARSFAGQHKALDLQMCCTSHCTVQKGAAVGAKANHVTSTFLLLNKDEEQRRDICKHSVHVEQETRKEWELRDVQLACS